MPGLKAPAWRHKETGRSVIVPDDGLGVKMVTGPGLLRKRCRSELEVVRGLVQKAARLVAVNGGAASHTNPGKNERFLAVGVPVATGRADGGVVKRRKTSPVVEVIEPRMSRGEREHLVASLSSLSLDLPSHIVEFMQRKCGAVLDGDEMEINLHPAGDVSLFQLKKLLDEFAVERKKRQLETEPEPRKDEDVTEDEFVDICGDASPVVVEKKLPETGDHSPSSSSSSSSGSSGSDSDSDESTISSPHPGDHPMEDAATAVAAAAEPPERIAPVQEKLNRAAPPAPASRIGDLIAKAQQEKRRCLRDLERKRAREELLEMERTAMPDDRIHPMDMVRLHIAEVEHVVTSGDKISPVRRFGLVMK